MPEENFNQNNNFNTQNPQQPSEQPLQNSPIPEELKQQIISQNPYYQQIPVTPQPQIPQKNWDQVKVEQGDFSPIIQRLRKHPGKSLFAATIFFALLFTFLPWVGPLFSKSSFNYFGLIGRNFFSIFYILGIFYLLLMRLIDWLNLPNFKQYKKIMDYIEILWLGGILMYVLSVGVIGDVQFGLALSVITALGMVIYITYLKLFKNQ